MRSIMLSVRPKWCELIANGKKTVEVRKTRPKLEVPFKVYIYCTQDKNNIFFDSHALMCPYRYVDDHSHNLSDRPLNCKVIGEFICDKIIYLGNVATDDWKHLVGSAHKELKSLVTDEACLTKEECLAYKGHYGWHISDLKIYDRPKELSEFRMTDTMAVKQCTYRERVYTNPDYTNGVCMPKGFVCNKAGIIPEPEWCNKCLAKPITRPPQSWQYVHEEQK